MIPRPACATEGDLESDQPQWDSDFICVHVCFNSVLWWPLLWIPNRAPSHTVVCMCQHHRSKLDQATASYSRHIAGIPHALMAW